MFNMHCVSPNRLICLFSIITLLLILLIPFALCQEYYADVKIIINPDGTVDITGETNHPLLHSVSKSEDFISKNKKYWLVNISLEESFSNYILEIYFPPAISLNYLKAPNILSIKDDNNRIVVTVSGSEEPLFFIAQYSFNEKKNIVNWSLYGIIFFSILLMLIIFLFAHILYKKTGNRIIQRTTKRVFSKLDSLPDRQKMIVEAIQKNKGAITQSELGRMLKIPKASLSRNIDSLIRRDIIVKERRGMTNLIMFKPEKEDDKLE